MNPPIRHTRRIVHATTTGMIAISLLAIASLLPPRPPAEPSSAPVQSPPTSGIADFSAIAQVLQTPAGAGVSGELARRFRLAGTILGVSNVAAEEPLAVIDDRQTVSQKIVRRNTDVVPGVRLTHIRSDAIVLVGPHGEETLFLEKTSAAAMPRPAGTPAEAESAPGTAPAGRFGGGLVFPGRWTFSRDVLLDYYSELRDEPERLLAVFDSMAPLYEVDPEGGRSITGYRVAVKGEADFFEAAGLKNGDVVRAVNSVTMTNRRRAEAFIRSFVEGNASTFVLDIEREGRPDKHVYVID